MAVLTPLIQPGNIDHGGLVGLADDDHLQYLLVDPTTRELIADLDFSLQQALNFIIERVAALPAAGTKGRLVYLDTDDRIYRDDGAAWKEIGDTDHGGLDGLDDDDHAQYLLVDPTTRKLIANLDFDMLEAVNFKIERVDTLPAFGNKGRLVFLNTDSFVYRDDGTAWGKVGVTDHGELTGKDDDDHPQYLLVDGSRAMTGALDMGSYAITNVGNVDGRDVSADGSTLDTHVADSTIHFTEASIDHGSIDGLDGDDHAQYLLVDPTTRELIADLDFSLQQALNFAIEVVSGSLPAAGTEGRLVYFSDDKKVYRDDGVAWDEAGVTDHGDLDGRGDDDHTQYLLVDGTRAMSGGLDMGTNAITNVGNVDGRDVSADGSTLDTHISDSSIHFTESSIDHGALQGRGDDDHTQYTLADGTRAFTGVVGGVSPTLDAHLATKGYVDSLIQGLSWQEPILDKDLVTSPAGVEGERYIVAGLGGDWSGFAVNDIVEYISSAWVKVTPDEGFACWVEDEDVLYVFNGSSWVKFGSTVDHGNLLGKDDDDHPQYLLADGTRAMSGGLDMGGFAISNVGNVDGRDVSTDGSTLDTHLNGGANKHDASEIDIEGTYSYFPNIPGNLETGFSDINSAIDTKQDEFTIVVQPSGDFAAIDAAATTLNGLGGGTIQLLEGTYNFGASSYTWNRYKNIKIKGKGPSTILLLDNVAVSGNPWNITGTAVGGVDEPVDDITFLDSSLTFTTPADAGAFDAGDWISIQYTDDFTGDLAYELLKVKTDGNPTTGVVELEWPVQRSGSSVVANGCDPSENMIFEDFKMVRTSDTGANARFMDLYYTFDCQMRNVQFETDTSTATSEFGIRITGFNGYWIIEDCKVLNCKQQGFSLIGLANSEVRSNYLRNCVTVGSGNPSAIYVAGRSNALNIKDNRIIASEGYGIQFDTISGENPRGVNVTNNYIAGIRYNGIRILTSIDTIVEGNQLLGTALNTSSTPAIDLAGAKRCRISKNTCTDFAFGISLPNTTQCEISNNILFGRLYGDGISMSNAEGCTVSGNTIRNVGYGISLGGTAQRNSISGNTITDVGSTDAIRLTGSTVHNNVFNANVTMGCRYAIAIAAGCYDNLIIGTMGGEESINDLGTNNQKIGNFV